MRNGFFQLSHMTDGTYIRLIPPEGSGEPLSFDEVREYLNTRKIAYNVRELATEIEELKKEEKLYKLSNDYTQPYKESYILHVSPDKMTATARFHAPSIGAGLLTLAAMKADLQENNIIFGVKEDRIKAFFADREYCRTILIAEGKPLELGENGTVEYMFPTDRKSKPTIREDGSVDFHNLNTICPCLEGELLAKRTLAVHGKVGRNVYGEEMAPPPVKESKLLTGKNITVSEDRLCAYAKMDGHVVLRNGDVTVSDLLELETVGVATGDVEHKGALLIKGNVCTGYSVKASGDIEIRGVVEGAYVESGGNISIAKGMNGMYQGVLKAKGSIVSKFIENAEVYTDGFVTAEAIFHSHVMAGTEVEVTGKKGYITGGRVTAFHNIRVKTIGSPMGAATIVEVGVNPVLKEKQMNLLQNMQDARRYIASIEPVLTAVVQKSNKHIKLSDDQMENIRQLAVARQEKKRELELIYRDLEELDTLIEASKDPYIQVFDEVYPGTQISVVDVSMTVKTNTKYCRFYRAAGEIRMTVLS